MKSKSKNPLVVLEDVWKIYRMGEVDVPALKGISLKIFEGEFVAIIGSSGSGKSTMMNLVGCLDVPSKGEIFLKGENINELSESDLATLRGKSVGFIFQQYNLLPAMTAFANVKLPLELQEIDDNTANKQVEKVLKLVSLGDKMRHYPSQLSGGQQQRVSIARCLAASPEIVLADEPTGALDSVTGREVLDILYNLWKDENKTIIMITHDLKLASKYASKIVELKDGEIMKVIDNTKNLDSKHNVKKVKITPNK